MKVLMTADAVGGVWTFVAELTRGLPDVRFVVATMGRRPLESQQREPRGNATLAIRDFKLEWEADPSRDIQADRMAETCREIYEALAREQAEAVLAAKVREASRAEALG